MLETVASLLKTQSVNQTTDCHRPQKKFLYLFSGSFNHYGFKLIVTKQVFIRSLNLNESAESIEELTVYKWKHNFFRLVMHFVVELFSGYT